MTFREYPISAATENGPAVADHTPPEPDWRQACRYAPDSGAHDFVSTSSFDDHVLLYCRKCGAYRT